MIIKEKYFTMSDGIKLYTRIVLPKENKKLPIVFIRTPYEEKRCGVPYPEEKYKDDLFIKNGYAVIVQHVRGRGDSEGKCIPYKERNDGLETLEIIRTLPFYNGEIYITGESYLATVHLCYLDTNPYDIKAAALGIQSDNLFNKNYRNGCCYDFCNLKWWLRMLKNRYPIQKEYENELYRPYHKVMERVVGEDVKGYSDFILNDSYNDFWKSQEQVHAIDKLTIPILFTEGWYDFYVDGMFSMWERLPNETKKKSAFVVGPWGHATKVTDKAEYDFENGNAPIDYIVNYFNSIRDNTKYTDFELEKVNYHSIGGDFWTTAERKTNYKKLYLTFDEKLLEKTSTNGEKNFIYNPDKPLDFYKHNNIFKAEKEDTNKGVLSFVSETFKEDTHFYGKIKWNMKVKSDCDDTAFFMRLYFVENGISYNLTETITSISHINKKYVAGDECLVSIFTPPVGFTIKKGNAIRVDISSHSDIYVPHSNVKGHWAKESKTKIATNTVICNDEAYVELPVVI